MSTAQPVPTPRLTDPFFLLMSVVIAAVVIHSSCCVSIRIARGRVWSTPDGVHSLDAAVARHGNCYFPLGLASA